MGERLQRWQEAAQRRVEGMTGDALWDKAEEQGYRLQVTKRRFLGGMVSGRMWDWTLYKGVRPVHSGRASTPAAASRNAAWYLRRNLK